MHLWNSIDCGPAFSGMEASGDGDENRNGKHGAFHGGLLEGHGFNWEAVRKEDQKRFNSLTSMNVFHSFELKNVPSHVSIQEAFM